MTDRVGAGIGCISIGASSDRPPGVEGVVGVEEIVGEGSREVFGVMPGSARTALALGASIGVEGLGVEGLAVAGFGVIGISEGGVSSGPSPSPAFARTAIVR